MHIHQAVQERAAPRVVMIQRHAVVTRLTHWLNAVFFCVLAASGMQIFNAWPQLYWGHGGADSAQAWLEIGAFPAWLTLPSAQDLAAGRRWHLFFAWCFVLNGAAYLAYGLLSDHFRRHLLPRRRELAHATSGAKWSTMPACALRTTSAPATTTRCKSSATSPSSVCCCR